MDHQHKIKITKEHWMTGDDCVMITVRCKKCKKSFKGVCLRDDEGDNN
jgi:hypothetical protein